METQTKTKLNTPAIDEETSRVISAIRIILALMILLCHCMTNFGNDSRVFNALQSFVLTNPMTACALPLFFVISGYLHFSRTFDYASMIGKKFKTVMVPYFIVCFATTSFYQAKNFLIHSGTSDVFIPWIFDFPCDRLFSFPVSGQLWFLRVLFFMFVASPVLKTVLEKLPALYFCATFLLLNSGLNIFGLPVPTYYELGNGLLFFGLGAFFSMKGFTVKTLDPVRTRDMVSVMVLVSAINLAFLLFPDAVFLGLTFRQMASHMSILTIASSSVLLIRIVSLAVKNEKAFETMKELSEYSMWIFLFQTPIPQWFADGFTGKIPEGNCFFMAVFVAFKIVFITAASLLSGIACRKICPPLFALISGGRAKKKIQQKAG